MRAVLILFLVGGLISKVVAQESTEPPPGWWVIPKTNTQIKVGGYIKLDLIHDLNPIGSPDFFDVSKIPTDGSKGKSTHLNVKETRLYIDTRSASRVGEIRSYLETDFYGSSGAFRIRHAYIEIDGKWLAGQTWSNFMDESIIPNTLDFEKPAAYAFARHPLIRYKHSLSTDSYFGIAIEEPSTSAQAPAAAGKFESHLPDLTGRYRITKPWGHVQLSAFIGKLTYRFTTDETDAITLYGGNLSGQFNLFKKKDKLFYQAVYGPGVGRFRGGLSAAPDENGELTPLIDAGMTIGLEHRWSEDFSSLFLYNVGRVNNTEGQPNNSIQGTDYVATNLLWYFTNHAFVGVEYLWGLRKDFDEAEGTANRIQLSLRYTFN